VNEPARIAVVGCGWWSTEAHLPAIAGHPDAELTAIVEPDPIRREAAVARFAPREHYESVEQLLAAGGVDGAICCVPHHLHHRLAAPLLDAGLHVVVDKPLTIDPADARDLLARARAAGVELIVGYPWHYHAQAVVLRDAIASARIGELEYVHCLFASVARALYAGDPEAYRSVLGYTDAAPGAATYSDPAVAGGGQGQTQLTHSAALLLWLTGLRPREVAAWTAAFELPVDLADALAVRFEGGAIGVLGSTGGVLPRFEDLLEYRIFGREGHVVFDVMAGTAAICDADGIEQLPEVAPEDRYPHLAPAHNLVDVVLGRGANASPGEIGVATVELVDAMYRASAAGGGAIALE
jgi:predicted dehydrogenase